jgi:large subunit ribosomal protein L4e
MFAPTKIWRKWHKKVNQNQRRFAVASALAASAIAPLVAARGHRIAEVAEIPLVVEPGSLTKTKEAMSLLKATGALADVDHVKDSRQIRKGVGKQRNRRHTQRRGPLVIYANDKEIKNAFRNIPGVDTCHVDRLNILQLAPGGHLGRFIIWTKEAFGRLDSIYGTQRNESQMKKGYRLPRPILTNPDITRIINSDEIQSVVRPSVKQPYVSRLKKNPLKNFGVMVKLNPHARVAKRAAIKADQAAAAAKAKGAARAKPTAAEKAKAKKLAANKKVFTKHIESFTNADRAC